METTSIPDRKDDYRKRIRAAYAPDYIEAKGGEAFVEDLVRKHFETPDDHTCDACKEADAHLVAAVLERRGMSFSEFASNLTMHDTFLYSSSTGASLFEYHFRMPSGSWWSRGKKYVLSEEAYQDVVRWFKWRKRTGAKEGA